MLLSSLLADAPPQTLAEAAAKAQEERRARQPVVTVSDRDFTFENPWQITIAGFRQYAAIRSDLKALRRYRPTLNTRLYQASARVERLAELAPAVALVSRSSSMCSIAITSRHVSTCGWSRPFSPPITGRVRTRPRTMRAPVDSRRQHPVPSRAGPPGAGAHSILGRAVVQRRSVRRAILTLCVVS